ncbi:MAG: NUDIX hydrolase [Phycisphaerales bacterium]|nr:NUDIX hydrolase [Phycisphaerales bacterium]
MQDAPREIELFAWPGSVRVTIGRDAAPAEAAADTPIGREWASQRDANPKLFNGQVLSVVSLDPALGHIACRRDSYQRLVVQPRIQTGVRMLAVTGVLLATDAHGARHVLFGRRGPGVRIYGGQWELGPSGGVSAPPASVQEITERGLAEHLADEVEEEIGLRVSGGVPVAVVRDRHACSDDVCMLLHLGPLAALRASPANWEYTEVAWVPVREVDRWMASAPGGVIGASRSLAAHLGWA